MAKDASEAAGWEALAAGSPQLHTGLQWQSELSKIWRAHNRVGGQVAVGVRWQ